MLDTKDREVIKIKSLTSWNFLFIDGYRQWSNKHITIKHIK